MSFGSSVNKPRKERMIQVSADHLMDHFHAFLLAGGLIGRDEVILGYNLPNTINITFKKVTKDGEGT